MHTTSARRDSWLSIVAISLFGVFFFSGCLPWPISILPNLLPRPERKIISNTLPLNQKWEHQINEILLAPLLSNGSLVYVPLEHALVALNAATGQQEWSFTTQHIIASVHPAMALSGNVIVFETVEGSNEEIKVLDAINGKIKWSKPALTVYSFAIGNGQIYVGRSGHVSAYSIENGSLSWEMSQGLPPSHSVITVVYAAERVYVITYNRVFVLDSTDGHPIHSFDYDVGRFVVVSSGVIYNVRWPRVIALDAESGKIEWERNIQPDATYIPPTLNDSALYIRTQSGELRAFDARTGAEQWVSKNIRDPFSNIVVLGDHGYVISKDGSVRNFMLDTGEGKGALITSPQSIARQSLGPPAIPSLALVGHTIVVTFGDSFVYGLEMESP